MVQHSQQPALLGQRGSVKPLHGLSWRRILKEERNYILAMIKKIRASGANVLLIQKSILRDAVTDLSLHYLVPPLLLAPSMLQRAHAPPCLLAILTAGANSPARRLVLLLHTDVADGWDGT